ncbi:MAG: Hsp70 family protein [Cyanobacteria bacterium K_Offshore_surface_m2_239]|nr:Hsp70 family protein [Cyanobacteria bacterium K_Offshore_surface_m2_239]
MAGTLAIDLGSTTTVVAWQEERGEPRLLALPPYSGGDPCAVPSLLWLSHPGQTHPLIGRQVVEAGLADRSGPGLCRDFKRSIGQAREVTPGLTGAGESGSWLSPEAAGDLLLRRLWEALPPDLEPARLILTAPVESCAGYGRWLREVCAALPVEEIALVDEPTAAAIGSGLPPGSRVLVVDFGGGTLDVSLVALQGGEGRAAPVAQLLRFAGRDLTGSRQRWRTARVLGKAGVPLGGRDLDRWIAADLCPDQPLTAELLGLAEALKCAVSDQEEALRILPSSEGGGGRALRLTRQDLERVLEERGLRRILISLLETVASAARREGFELSRIDAVLPVGGSSRLPWLRRLIQEWLPEVPLRDERPVAAVALGALALTPGVRIQDVLSQGVSLRVWDQRSRCHLWHPLFVPGQPWPTPQPLELVLASASPDQAELELVLGTPLAEERPEVIFAAGVPVIRSMEAGAVRVRPWAQPPIVLPLSPAGEAGVDRLRLRFTINVRGELVLDAEDLLSRSARPSQVLGVVR